MESGGKEFNYALSRSLKENGKSLSLNASCDAPTTLKESHSLPKITQGVDGDLQMVAH